jgi:6-phosphogluconolactonase
MKACIKLWSAMAIGLTLLAGPLRGEFVYVANFNGNGSLLGSVSAYRLGPHGALTPVAGSPFPAGNLSESVAVDHRGRFAYVANSGSNNVSAYRLGPHGALTPVAGSPFPTEFQPASVTVSP